MYSKKFTKIVFFSLNTELFSVLFTQTVRNSVCELYSVRYIRVCLHVHKHFNRNEKFCSRYSECVCVLFPRPSVQFIHVAYFRVFVRTLLWTMNLWETFHCNFIYPHSFCQKAVLRGSGRKNVIVLMIRLGLESWPYV